MDADIDIDYRIRMALPSGEYRKILELAASINARNRRERIRNQKLLRKRVERAHAEVERLAEVFRKTDPNIQRIVLFGSVARNAEKRLGFDIDIAVESSKYSDLLDLAAESAFKVDLVDLSCASSYIRNSIERDGKEVYRADS